MQDLDQRRPPSDSVQLESYSVITAAKERKKKFIFQLFKPNARSLFMCAETFDSMVRIEMMVMVMMT